MEYGFVNLKKGTPFPCHSTHIPLPQRRTSRFQWRRLVWSLSDASLAPQWRLAGRKGGRQKKTNPTLTSASSLCEWRHSYIYMTDTKKELKLLQLAKTLTLQETWASLKQWASLLYFCCCPTVTVKQQFASEWENSQKIVMHVSKAPSHCLYTHTLSTISTDPGFALKNRRNLTERRLELQEEFDRGQEMLNALEEQT